MLELIEHAAVIGAVPRELTEVAGLVRIFDGGRASVTVTRSNTRQALVGWLPAGGGGGGVRLVPLTSEPLVDVTFADDAFTFHLHDGRAVSVTWRGLGELACFTPRKEQCDPSYLERLFLNLRPRRSSGVATSAVAGELSASPAYYGYVGELTCPDGPLYLMIRAINAKQLQALVPALDRVLENIAQTKEAARRFVVERVDSTPDEVAPLPISEMIFYDSGAFDLVMTPDEQSLQNGVDFFTIHFDLRLQPFDVSMN